MKEITTPVSAPDHSKYFSHASRIGALAATLVLMSAPAVRADDAPAGSDGSFMSPVADYFRTWFDRVSKTQAEQPHWVTPLATVTPRLEEELRYDQAWQAVPGNHEINNYGLTKGLELIPCEYVELIIGIPAYEMQNTTPAKNGWSDETFLLKYRLLSANKEDGDYILTAFMGLSVPSGSDVYTSHHFSYTPTIAGGKGWGDFDFQSTLGVSIPDDGAVRTGPGMSVVWNTALQYHIAKYLWPEVEANYTYWPNGKHEGLSQLFITPALLVGRIPIYERLGLTVGFGAQIAVTDMPLMHNNIILSARLPF